MKMHPVGLFIPMSTSSAMKQTNISVDDDSISLALTGSFVKFLVTE